MKEYYIAFLQQPGGMEMVRHARLIILPIIVVIMTSCVSSDIKISNPVPEHLSNILQKEGGINRRALQDEEVSIIAEDNQFLVNGIYLGLSIDEVIKQFGPPDEIQDNIYNWYKDEAQEIGITVYVGEDLHVTSLVISQMAGAFDKQLNEIKIEGKQSDQIITLDGTQVLTYYPSSRLDAIDISYTLNNDVIEGYDNNEESMEIEDDSITNVTGNDKAVDDDSEEELMNETIEKDEQMLDYEKEIMKLMDDFTEIVSIINGVEESDYNIDNLPSFEDSGSYMITTASIRNKLEFMKKASITQEVEVPILYLDGHEDLLSSVNYAEKAMGKIAAISYLNPEETSAYIFEELWDDYRLYEDLFKDNFVDAVQNYHEIDFEIMKIN